MRPAQSSMLPFCHSAGSWGVIRLSNSAANPARLRLMCWSRPVSHTQCLCGRSPLWSAAACCRFGVSQLAGWELCPRLKFPQASPRAGKRQQAAALQSFASTPTLPNRWREIRIGALAGQVAGWRRAKLCDRSLEGTQTSLSMLERDESLRW